MHGGEGSDPPANVLRVALIVRCIGSQEGQYLYLNCPHINADEWHPFTISSAQDDLYSGKQSIWCSTTVDRAIS